MSPKSTFIVMLVLSSAECSKLRSWMGPTKFIDGQSPISRDGAGFSSIDGMLYVFGGTGGGTGGKSFCKGSVYQALIMLLAFQS